MEMEGKGKAIKLRFPKNAEVIDFQVFPDTGKVTDYEVLLSCRSSHYTTNCRAFCNYLYNHLICLRVGTFWDHNNLPQHVSMSRLVKASKISIPIFCRNYASSEWCLGELTQMVEYSRTTGHLIMPIFYDVQRSDVKLQTECYEEAFREHALRFDPKTVEAWKMALREVGDLKGWDFIIEPDRSEGIKFIKEDIVPKILLELKKNYMAVTDTLVGMDIHVKEVLRLLDNVPNQVRTVGIHGIGGIGKTTIAKFIYSKLLKCFDCCSFLADVRERLQQPKGVSTLQKQLLADTLKSCPEFADVDSGIHLIKNIVAKKKVLIVLDDVDESSHFTRLVGKRDWFHSGSIIIVTTKDGHVLDDLRVDASYEVPSMDHVQSLQLFSMHAFRKKEPPSDYFHISSNVASAAARIPLVLEVLGSFLSSMEKAVWEDTLKKLEKLSDDEVDKKLRVVYEALDYAQQHMFLDIACLFSGVYKAAAFYMWDDCGYHPKRELNVLLLMSIMKVAEANELKMHDQFRALGRKIISEEKTRGNRSRLWNHEEALNILEGRRGTEKIEALSLHFELGPEKKPRFTSKEFAKLVNLRYLQVDGMELVGNFEHRLPRLRWLKWHSCPPHFKPTNFYLENLVILDLSNSGITEDWGGWNQIKMAKKLKVLVLTNCALRRTPDFSAYVALERLILQRCKSLVEVDVSIGKLKNLKVFDISYADIRNIPDEIWMLEKLEVMDFTHCSYLKGHIPPYMRNLRSLRFLSFYDTKIQSLPMSIGELSCLQTLKLGGCTELQSLPLLPSSLRVLYVSSIHNLKNLVHLQELHFVGCCGFVEIPRDIWLLSKLEKLTLESTNIRTLSKEIVALSQLMVLNVQYCHELQSILGLPSNLVDLSLSFCYSLEKLPNLSNLKKLLRLSVRSCIKLTEVQGLGNLESLTSLDIYACDMLANLVQHHQSPCLLSLESLKYMDLHGCNSVGRTRVIETLKSSEEANMPVHHASLLEYMDLHCRNNVGEVRVVESLKSSEDPNVSVRHASLNSYKSINLFGDDERVYNYHSSSSAAASPNPGSPSSDPLRDPLHLPDGYLSDDPAHATCSSNRRAECKKGTPWTEEEHRLFLLGLQKLGKGDWRGISRSYVISRTPTQVASHAQKYFIRQSNLTRRKRRSSLFDIVPEMAMDPPPVPEEQFMLPPSQAVDAENKNALPSLSLSLKPEFEPMEANSLEMVKEAKETAMPSREMQPPLKKKHLTIRS